MPTLSIEIPTTAVQRIVDAFTYARNFVDENGDPRAATMADVRAHVIEDLKQYVSAAERRKAIDDYIGADHVNVT